MEGSLTGDLKQLLAALPGMERGEAERHLLAALEVLSNKVACLEEAVDAILFGGSNQLYDIRAKLLAAGRVPAFQPKETL